MNVNLIRGSAIVIAAWALALPAFADIKAFNAAVTRGDYRSAAAAAAETWPTLDKSRPDIDVIAREFGYAAVMAEDFKAAQAYAQSVVDHQAQPGASQEYAEVSNELLRLAQFKGSPSGSTRDKLFQAVSARAALPGFDNISYLAVDALVAYDTKAKVWAKAKADDALAVSLTEAGGPVYAISRRRYQFGQAIASYMDAQKPPQYATLLALEQTVFDDMATAPSDEVAKAFAPVYWAVAAWSNTMSNHLEALGFKSQVKKLDAEHKANEKPRTDRVAYALGREDDDQNCKRKLKLDPMPSYPSAAEFRGYLSTIVLQVDIDPQGQAINPKLLASAPEQYFGEAVLKSVGNLSFSPGTPWDPSVCKLPMTGKVIFFNFIIEH